MTTSKWHVLFNHNEVDAEIQTTVEALKCQHLKLGVSRVRNSDGLLNQVSQAVGSLFDDPKVSAEEIPSPELPEMTAQDQVVEDYSSAGLTLRKHPVSFLRDQLTRLRVVTAEQLSELSPDRRVKVAGLVLMRQRPSTASGITFVTLEDETGVANLVVYPSVWQHFRQTARFASVMMATGRLQREGDVIHVVCERLDDVSEMLAQIESRARNFR